MERFQASNEWIARAHRPGRAPDLHEQTLMISSRSTCFGIALAVTISGWATDHTLRTGRRPADVDGVPKLMHTCLITNDVSKLVQFYEPVLAVGAQKSGEEYVEFSTGVGVLAIFSVAAQEKYIPGSTKAAQNKSVILEFQVADVDKEFVRLQTLVKTWVKPPTTQPWGTRSIYFRDPDGNLVDFYTPVKSR